MREIKFRAWDKQAQNMLRINAIDFKNKEFLEAEDFDAPEGATRSVITLPKGLFPEHFELMQFTGLLDKNGKEIWEGDIIKIYHINIPSRNSYIINYQNGGFHICFLNTNNPIANEAAFNFYSDHKEDGCEVIGNIYENPEILHGIDPAHEEAKSATESRVERAE